ncbi:hypothetical protein K154301001_17810 [Clostridium tetani]|nr:hypothetical protein K154301001_17810 [Clostridium tetani]SUY66974.1 Uncharacterised protein [Clostridium tetani]
MDYIIKFIIYLGSVQRLHRISICSGPNLLD